MDKLPDCTHITQDADNRGMIYLYFKDDDAKRKAMQKMAEQSCKYGASNTHLTNYKFITLLTNAEAKLIQRIACDRQCRNRMDLANKCTE